MSTLTQILFFSTRVTFTLNTLSLDNQKFVDRDWQTQVWVCEPQGNRWQMWWQLSGISGGSLQKLPKISDLLLLPWDYWNRVMTVHLSSGLVCLNTLYSLHLFPVISHICTVFSYFSVYIKGTGLKIPPWVCMQQLSELAHYELFHFLLVLSPFYITLTSKSWLKTTTTNETGIYGTEQRTILI